MRERVVVIYDDINRQVTYYDVVHTMGALLTSMTSFVMLLF